MSASACGGGGDTGGTTEPTPTPTPVPTPTIGLTSTAASLSLNAGATQVLSLTVSRGGGYAGAVDIVAEGAPSGVTVTFGSVGSGNSVTVTATVRADTLAAPGTYTVTARATGSGVAAATASVALTVMPRPSLSATASTNALSVVQGARGTVAVVLRRTNMSDSVTVTVGSVPTGVTASASPARVVGDTTLIAFDVSAAAAAGTYPTVVTLTATSGVVTVPVSLTVVAAPSYALSLSSTTLSIIRGGTATSTLTIARINFSDAVNLSAASVPSGMTVSFSPTAPTGNSSTITVTTTAALAQGTYAIGINGAASAGSHSATLTVIALAPSLALSVSPTTFTTGAGTVLSASAALTRTNMTTPVSITLTPTAGFTLETNPATLPADAATISLTVASSVAPGAYSLTLRAVDAATGTTVASAPVTLTVNVSAPTGPITFDYSGCTSASVKPLFVAFQDGPGAPWVAVPNVGDRYTVNPTQSRVGFAYVWSTQFHHHVIRYYTRDELASIAGVQCAPDVSTLTLQIQPTTGTVYFSSFSNTMSPAPFAGGQSLRVPRHMATLSALWLPAQAERITLLRDFDARFGPSNITVPVAIDYNTAVPVVTSTVTATNVGSRTIDYREQSLYDIRQVWRTDLGAFGPSCGRNGILGVISDSSSVFKAYTIPLAQLRSTDIQAISVRAVSGEYGTADYREEIGEVRYRDVAPTTIRVPDALAAPSVTLAGSAPARLRVQFDLPANGSYAAMLQTFGAQYVTNSATMGWLGGTHVDLTTPNFRGLAGYTSSWLPDGTSAAYSISASGGTIAPGATCSSIGTGTAFSLTRNGVFIAANAIGAGRRKGP